MARAVWRNKRMDTILVAAGDGIGPEVVEAALHVIDGLGLDIELVIEPVGMAGYQERGAAITDATVDLAREADAILFGAVTTPPPSKDGYRSPLLTLRRDLDLFANVRPARSLVPWLSRIGPSLTQDADQGLDVIVVRENTEGLYVGRERDVKGGVVAEKLVTEMGTERIVRFAADLAQDRGRGKVTCVHKANLLRRSDGLFLETFRRVMTAEAPGLEISDIHVDAAAAAMVSDPSSMDVMVTPNLYGDILSDLAASLTGGLGLAPSANFGTGTPLFEPVHGSAPDIAGKGVADPIGCMLSAGMMLDYLDHHGEAKRLVSAIIETVMARVTTPDLGGTHTTLGFAGEVRDRL
jgi:3-isopropylmalate dehydrogenase/methanogen homoisocitrate dehydrogenase